MHEYRFPRKFQELLGNTGIHPASASSGNYDNIVRHLVLQAKEIKKSVTLFRYNGLSISDLILDDHHGIAITVELIFLFNGYFVCIHYVIISAKCSHHHEECTFRHMEIGNHAVGNAEIVRRKNKFIRPAVKRFQVALGGNRVSIERITVVPTAQTLFFFSRALLTISQA